MHLLWTLSVSNCSQKFQSPLKSRRGNRREKGRGEIATVGTPCPSCLSVTDMEGITPQHEQPRSDATVNTQLAGACLPPKDWCPPKKKLQTANPA